MRRNPTLLLLSLILVTAPLGAVVTPGATAQETSCGGPADHSARDAVVEGGGGTDIAVTIFRPAGSSTVCPVPVILHGHGWSGSRETNTSAFDHFLDRGYAVVSIDQRGHGESGGQAHVMHPDKEVRDVQAVIDRAAALPWVETEGEDGDDPVLGAVGGSYGGGYQLMTALHDDRFDALIPEITWHDLPRALAPNGVIRSAWNDLLYAAGVASVDMPAFIHAGFAWGASRNDFPDGETPGEPNLDDRFSESSPFRHPAHGHEIEAPTLLIQGMNDTLFPVNHAIDNLHQIERGHGPDQAKVVTHLGGHLVHTDLLLGESPLGGTGIQTGDGGDPCGSTQALQLAWFEEHLKEDGDDGDGDGLPEASVALDDGTCATSEAVQEALLRNPLEHPAYDLSGPVPLPGSGGAVPVPQPSPLTTTNLEAAGTVVNAPSPVRLEVLDASEASVVAGVPRLEGNVTVGGSEAVVFFSLVVEEPDGDTRVLNSQVTPFHKRGPANRVPFALEMAGVGTRLQDGGTLYLQVSTNDPQFIHNQQRLPGGAVLEDLQLHVPVAS